MFRKFMTIKYKLAIIKVLDDLLLAKALDTTMEKLRYNIKY